LYVKIYVWLTNFSCYYR